MNISIRPLQLDEYVPIVGSENKQDGIFLAMRVQNQSHRLLEIVTCWASRVVEKSCGGFRPLATAFLRKSTRGRLDQDNVKLKGERNTRSSVAFQLS